MASGDDGSQTHVAPSTWSASLPPQLGPTPKFKPAGNPTKGFATQVQTQQGDHKLNPHAPAFKPSIALRLAALALPRQPSNTQTTLCLQPRLSGTVSPGEHDQTHQKGTKLSPRELNSPRATPTTIESPPSKTASGIQPRLPGTVSTGGHDHTHQKGTELSPRELNSPRATTTPIGSLPSKTYTNPPPSFTSEEEVTAMAHHTPPLGPDPDQFAPIKNSYRPHLNNPQWSQFSEYACLHEAVRNSGLPNHLASRHPPVGPGPTNPRLDHRPTAQPSDGSGGRRQAD